MDAFPWRLGSREQTDTKMGDSQAGFNIIVGYCRSTKLIACLSGVPLLNSLDSIATTAKTSYFTKSMRFSSTLRLKFSTWSQFLKVKVFGTAHFGWLLRPTPCRIWTGYPNTCLFVFFHDREKLSWDMTHASNLCKTLPKST